MNKLFFLVFIASLVACNPEPIANVTGTIQNQVADVIIVSNQLLDSNDTLKIIDGNFNGALNVETAGMYSLNNGKYGFRIFLEPGDNLVFNFDIDKLKKGTYAEIEISGEGADETLLMLDLSARNSRIMADFKTTLALPSDSFQFLIKNYHIDVQSAIDSFKNEGVSDNFFHERIELITGIELNEKYMYYTTYHKRMAPNDTLPIPSDFYNVGKDIALDNEQFYKELKTYKFFVLKKHDAKMKDALKAAKHERGSVEEANAKIDYVVGLNVIQDIKDELGNRIVASYTYASDEVKEVYEKRYTEIIKKEKFITGFKSLLATLEALKPGNKAPSFAYHDVNSKMVNSEDLKGKVIYIDVWATWCGPCVGEIPHLKALEEELHDLDVAFVSISIDGDKEAWKKMVAKKELRGHQLYADGEWGSDIIKNYAIKGIPRFILIDKEGNLVSASANRPSSKNKIKNQLIDLAKS